MSNKQEQHHHQQMTKYIGAKNSILAQYSRVIGKENIDSISEATDNNHEKQL